MAEKIWTPVGISSTTFRPRELSNKMLVPLTVRVKPNELMSNSALPSPDLEPIQDGGGSGLFSTAGDFLEILKSLLFNDGKLIRPSTIAMMFEPQLEINRHLMANIDTPGLGEYIVPGMPLRRNWNWGLGGILATDGIPGRAGDGCMMWNGLPNTYWVSGYESLIQSDR